jgi:phosphatidylethanolamine-binding protein (PEBP) family uncharacterized protein
MEQVKLTISSPEFIEEGLIPIKFTCKGEGFNLTLVIDGIPAGTQSMVLIMEDIEDCCRYGYIQKTAV